jgi:PhnB protein
MARPVPEGTRTVTPHLVIKGAAEAIEFYKKAFGAIERSRMPGPDGRSLMHAEIRIGDSLVYLADEFPGVSAQRAPESLSGTSVVMHLYLEDVDKAFQRAVDAGATVQMPLMDAFWGDRYGQVRDPYGHVWAMATHKEDVSNEEMTRRGQEAMAATGPPPAQRGSEGRRRR